MKDDNEYIKLVIKLTLIKKSNLMETLWAQRGGPGFFP
jgi:hypothetical protein